MGEANNSGEEEVKDDKSGTDENAEGAKGSDDTRKENDGEGSDDKGADESESGDNADDKGSGEDGSEKSEKKDDKETDKKNQPNADEEPPARKRNIDFILARKNAKIAKEKDKGNGKDDEGDDDTDGIAPEDAAVIDKRVQKILSPFIDKQVAEENKQEADTFVAANPHFKPYLDKVLKWAGHPTRQNIPIESIFYEVAGKDLLKIGAELGKKADDKAKETNAGGGANRGGNGGGTKSVWDMSTEEFEAEQGKVRNKQAE